MKSEGTIFGNQYLFYPFLPIIKKLNAFANEYKSIQII